jgi:hypothetical protein
LIIGTLGLLGVYFKLRSVLIFNGLIFWTLGLLATAGTSSLGPLLLFLALFFYGAGLLLCGRERLQNVHQPSAILK